MKISSRITTAVLCSLGFSTLYAQEAPTTWDVEIPGTISDGTRTDVMPKKEPIESKILSSHTKRMAVTETQEFIDLPPVTKMVNVTLQVLEEPKLPEVIKPLEALTPEDPTVVERMSELSEAYQGTQLIFVSASVYDHNRTLVTIYPNGKAEGSITAWSNIDFNHFSGFSTFRVKDAVDGTLFDYGLIMGLGNEKTEEAEKTETKTLSEDRIKAPESLRDLAVAGPSFVVVEGKNKGQAMDTLEQIHDLYRKEGARMHAAYLAREKAEAERRAELIANPKQPKDIVIQFWKRDTPSEQGLKNLNKGAQP